MDSIDENLGSDFFDIKPVIFFNMVLSSVSLLLPHWFVLFACSIIIVEGLVIHYYLKDFKSSFAISAIVNTSSALFAMVLDFLPPFFGIRQSIFSGLLGSLLIFLFDLGTYLLIILPFFLFVCGLTILIELGVSFILIPTLHPDKRLEIFSLTNVFSYSLLVIFNIIFGLLTALTNPTQPINSLEFFEGKLFQTLSAPTNSTPLFEVLISLVLLIVLFIIYFQFDPLHLNRPSEK